MMFNRLRYLMVGALILGMGQTFGMHFLKSGKKILTSKPYSTKNVFHDQFKNDLNWMVKSKSNPDTYKKFYLALMKKYHPDHDKTFGANERFIEIQAIFKNEKKFNLEEFTQNTQQTSYQYSTTANTAKKSTTNAETKRTSTTTNNNGSYQEQIKRKKMQEEDAKKAEEKYYKEKAEQQAQQDQEKHESFWRRYQGHLTKILKFGFMAWVGGLVFDKAYNAGQKIGQDYKAWKEEQVKK